MRLLLVFPFFLVAANGLAVQVATPSVCRCQYGEGGNPPAADAHQYAACTKNMPRGTCDGLVCSFKCSINDCKDPTSGIFNGTTAVYLPLKWNPLTSARPIKSFVLPNGKKWDVSSGINVGFAKEKDVCVGFTQKGAAAILGAPATSMVLVVAAIYTLLA